MNPRAISTGAWVKTDCLLFVSSEAAVGANFNLRV
jgi:hypothetical protein